MKRFRSVYFTKAFHIFLAAMAGILLWQLCLRFLHEWSGPIGGDTSIYLAVGRGILNGLLPYVDLFDPKAIGIHLISAASLLLFDSPFLGNIINAFSLFIYPLAIAYGAIRFSGGAVLSRPALRTALYSFLMAGIIGLFTAQRSGEFQVESFASLFSVAYIVTVSLPGSMGYGRLGAAAVCLLAAIGLKEPYLLTLLGSALILFSYTPELLLTRFLLPLLIAAVTGILVLAWMHILIPYFTVYAEEMLVREIYSERGAFSIWHPLFMIVKDLKDFSPPFAGFILLLALATLMRPLMVKTTRTTAIVHCIFTLLACGLTIFSIALTGKYWSHHFAMAVPVYTSMALLFIRERRDDGWYRTLETALLSSVALTLICYKHPDYKAMNAFYDRKISEARNAAAYIDNIMNSCGYERYLFLGNNHWQPYGFTKHSPSGVVFAQMWFLTPSRPEFRRQFMEAVYEAPLIVINNMQSLRDLRPRVEKEIQDHFSESPVPCAANAKGNPGPYKILYRLTPKS